MLSDEALERADSYGNRSEYIESLVMGGKVADELATTDSVLLAHMKAMEKRLISLLEERSSVAPPTLQAPADPLDALASQAFVPRPPNPLTGYPCCERPAPCKHWVFDGNEGVWRNNLTGTTRDA